MVFDLVSYLLGKYDAFNQDTSQSSRFLIGITGPPAAGKSTISAWLSQALGERIAAPCTVVPMDGFHLDNEVLEERGLRHLKGVPATFDAQGFVALIKRIKLQRDEHIFFPLFDRSNECVVPDAACLRAGTRLVIVEGNYLLNEEEPWHQLRYHLDEIVYIDCDADLLHKRLIDRHMAGGMSASEAAQKVSCTDTPNAELIRRTKNLASKQIIIETA